MSNQPLTIPAIASAGAAVLHAAAASVQADHVGLSRIFIGLAVLQASASILGFVRPDRVAATMLLAVNAGAAGGWLLTRLIGLSWMSGLEVAERPQLADTSAAALAFVVVAAATAAILGRSPTLPNRAVANAAILAGVLVVPGLADATTTDDADHGSAIAGDTGNLPTRMVMPVGAATPLPILNDEVDAAHPDHVPGPVADSEVPLHSEAVPEAEPATVAVTVARPYDPALPIDLGGIEGVTLEQQAFAENLVASTVRDLPQWSNLDVVEAAGFRSIGDAATGHEHYINFDWINDDIVLDGDFPESLVFEPQPDGSKTLVSAMYMLPSFIGLDEVPDWGGALMQWHVHRDLCFTDEAAPRVAGVKPVGSSCTPPLVDGTEAPMIHVWIRPHECGPFASLDGIGGGQVPDGEDVLCDTAHGHG
jgi:hypothetical protein